MKTNLWAAALAMLVLMGLSGCRSERVAGPELGPFDLAPDGRAILFNYMPDRQSGWSIYRYDFSAGKSEVLIGATASLIHYSPVHSPDGMRFAFITETRGVFNNRLSVADMDGGHLATITTPEGHVSEVVFSHSGKSLIYMVATRYGNSSPMAPKALHGFDIYEVELDTKVIRKLTHLNAYRMGKLSVLDENRLVFRLDTAADSGLKVLSVETAEPTVSSFQVPAGLEQDHAMFYAAVASPLVSKMLLTAPYRLYAVNADRTGAKLLSSDPSQGHIGKAQWMSETQVVFSRSSSTDLYVTGANGGSQRTIKLFQSDERRSEPRRPPAL